MSFVKLSGVRFYSSTVAGSGLIDVNNCLFKNVSALSPPPTNSFSPIRP